MMCDTEIREIMPSDAESIIDTRQPLGLFYCKEGTVYVGIDNTDGDAWTEDFKALNACIKWLRGL